MAGMGVWSQLPSVTTWFTHRDSTYKGLTLQMPGQRVLEPSLEDFEVDARRQFLLSVRVRNNSRQKAEMRSQSCQKQDGNPRQIVPGTAVTLAPC